MFVVLAALVTVVGGAGPAEAAGGTYRVVVGGNPILGWTPDSGSIDQTSDDALAATGTLVSAAPMQAPSGPPTTRSSPARASSAPRSTGRSPSRRGSPYGFDPGMSVVSTTELTINGPDAFFVNTDVNLHVDGVIEAPVCGGPSPVRRRGGLGLHRSVHSAGGVQHVRGHARQLARAHPRPGSRRLPRPRRRDVLDAGHPDEHALPGDDHARPERGLLRGRGADDVRPHLRRSCRALPGELRADGLGPERHPERLHGLRSERGRQPLDRPVRHRPDRHDPTHGRRGRPTASRTSWVGTGRR